MTPRTVVQLRLSDEEKATWQGAADAAGLTLSAWARGVLDVEAASTTEVVVQRAPVRVEPAPTASPAPARESCPRARHHRTGTFCRHCGFF